MKEIFKHIIMYILQAESRLVLWRYKPKVVAITGSVGKTSTKDAVYSALSGMTHVRKSEKSYNSEFGLPLTILGMPTGWSNPFLWIANVAKGLWLFLWPHRYPKWLVLEAGVGKPGDMKRTAGWIKTDAVIVTAIGETPVHIEFFESRKHLIEEKSGLIKTLKPDGVLILNADDEAVLSMKEKTKCRVKTYGFGDKAELKGSGENIYYDESGVPRGTLFRVDEEGTSLPVVIEGVFGSNHVYAAMATLALASALGLNMIETADALKKYDLPPGRMRLLRGINGSLIIDDTYNSSPFACKASLETLGQVKTSGRRIAVLGDMLELGKHTEDEHRKIGEIARENANVLLVVGQRAEKIKEGALSAGMQAGAIEQFPNSYSAGDFLKTFVQPGDLVLIKGSQGMRMERAVAAILDESTGSDGNGGKQDRKKLLVRQDKEWLRKK